MVVMNNFQSLLCTRPFGGIDNNSGVIIAVNLTALRVLHPRLFYSIRNRQPFRRIGIQHPKKHFPQRWRIDVSIKEVDIGVIRIVRYGIEAIFGVPFVPTFDQRIVG